MWSSLPLRRFDRNLATAPRPRAFHRMTARMNRKPQLDDRQAIRPPPAGDTTEEQIDFALRCAIAAPSSHNAQPWQFRVEGDRIELYADRSRALPVVDPQHRELAISCGAALFHLRVALRAQGRDLRIERVPVSAEPDLLARVVVGDRSPAQPADLHLLTAIAERRTNRQPFGPRSLSAALRGELERAAAAEGPKLVIVDAEETRQKLIDLVTEGDRRQWRNHRFRSELAAWTRPNHSDRRDGISGHSLGQGEIASVVSPLVVRALDLGAGQAARDRRLAGRSPTLAVLFTDWDAPADWIAAGGALAHLLLRAQVDGVSASFLNQPVEDTALRPVLRTLLGERGFPQLAMRLGYPEEPVQRTARRALADVLLGA